MDLTSLFRPGVPRAPGGAALQGQQPVRGGGGGQSVPGHHAENGSAHRAVPGEGPGPVHHGYWETGLGYEGSQGNRSSPADAGKLIPCVHIQQWDVLELWGWRKEMFRALLFEHLCADGSAKDKK